MHWLLLIGLLFLLVSSALPNWIEAWPSFTGLINRALSGDPQKITPWDRAAAIATSLGSLVLLLSFVASAFLAFTSPPGPFRKYLGWVFVPAVLGTLIPIAFGTLARNVQETSVLQSELPFPPVHDFEWLTPGPGPLLMVAAIVLLGICFRRAEIGKLALPLRFASEQVSWPNSADTEIRRKILLFFLLTTSFLGIWGAFGSVFGSLVGDRWNVFEVSPFLLVLITIFSYILYVPLPTRICWGPRWRQELKEIFRLASVRDYVLALAIPAGLFYGSLIVSSLFGRVAWNATKNEEYLPASQFADILVLPEIWTITYLFSALCEEVGWRGFFQKNAVQVFGINHGLMLTCLAWSVWHLPGDLSRSTSFAAAGIAVGSRLVSTMLMGALIGWLFMRSGSVLPVTVMHAASNAFISTVFLAHESLHHIRIIRIALLAAVVWFLYRRWPPSATVAGAPTADEDCPEATAPVEA